MRFELSLARPRLSPSPISSFPVLHFRGCQKLGFPIRCSQEPRLRFKVLGQSLGDGWKLKDIDPSAVQDRLNLWLLKTQNFLNEVASPLVKTGQMVRKTDPENALDTQEIGELFLAEQTIDCRTPNGNLSLAAIASIEQFSRMNGLSGKKMQRIFEALAPESVCYDARNLVEYCCFRFLSRDSSDIHPCLKEPAFQRLVFITMLAWGHPYSKDTDSSADGLKSASLQGKLIGEEAFIRIAPAVAGVADRSTAHNIFKALAGDDQGISLSSWTTYVGELLKVHEGRMSYQTRESLPLSNEQILCIGSSKKRPVLKWENNMAWPGKLTLTDKALYFEAIGLKGQTGAIRMDLNRNGSQVEKARVGPFGSALFDSAVSVSSGPESETWVLEFVDFGGEMRRDVWHAFISEVIALYEFIREFGPEEGDQSMHQVYGAHKGNRRATVSTINSIARLQALQFIRKLSEDPAKLVQFSYLRSAPYGDIVCQTLAVNFWGGPLVTKFTEAGNLTAQGIRPSDEAPGSSIHVFDIDGSVYLRKWMKSLSWTSNASINLWKISSVRQGVVLTKNLVVADMTLVERASATCREKSQVVEKTQATIDAAMIQGIPSNIDLFKELLFPLSVTMNNFEKLRRWEEPHLTVSFLAFSYAIIFRNLLPYIFPTTLMAVAAGMLLLKGLKEQGRLGRSFGKVTIRDQPPSNTIQKIIALREAMRDLEIYLQNLNVTLLKIRTIVLSGQPQITTEVALVLLCSATVLLVVPFRYILAFFLLDLFTRELEFRREMVMKFMSFLKERWDTVPAAPVVVLPYESGKNGPVNCGETIDEQGKPERIESSGKPR
ncbi:uncharacterized protein LOC122076755 isoform X2 [Macadamia integrifolia]|uniref:uncharacterized protein LOC122076755 isoform X2 n=1 Tax=Macadamia integrifolia TaxID=60698 RepID=UPI001C4ED6F8|nr:uncharacterized protein LOC122076755 isoform X2 [Macadamia integrifolia]